MSGPAEWDADATISNAIEIRDGVVMNPKILSFQHRAASFPHTRETPDPVLTPAALHSSAQPV